MLLPFLRNSGTHPIKYPRNALSNNGRNKLFHTFTPKAKPVEIQFQQLDMAPVVPMAHPTQRIVALRREKNPRSRGLEL